MKRTPIEAPKSKDGDIPEMKARVTITLKPGVLDPQGKAIEHALDNLGFSGVEAARAGKVIELDLADGTCAADIDRKSVVSGTRWSVGGDPGGRRSNKKKKYI